MFILRFFFFQAEDGIRDRDVTGVQTCALPISFKSALLESAVQLQCPVASASVQYALDDGSVADEVCYWRDMTLVPHLLHLFFKREIRSSCSFSLPKVRAGNRKEITRELRDEIMAMRS